MTSLPYTEQQIIEAHELLARVEAHRLISQLPAESLRKTVKKNGYSLKLFTPEQTAEILEISPTTLRDLKKQGQIKPIMLTPKTPRYSASEIERYLSELGKD